MPVWSESRREKHEHQRTGKLDAAPGVKEFRKNRPMGETKDLPTDTGLDSGKSCCLFVISQGDFDTKLAERKKSVNRADNRIDKGSKEC